MNKWLNITHQKWQQAILPPICVLCGDPGLYTGLQAIDLCGSCNDELPRLTSACARCAEPLSGELAAEALCGQCLVTPPAFERCLSLFRYQPPTDYLIQALKFHGRLELALLLGNLMAEWLSQVTETKPDCLVPVPLHAHRLRERGFNQATEIAKQVARRLGCSLDIHCCERIKTTAPQSDLSKKDRAKNMKGAFKVHKALSGHIVILDDVMTTGSTAHELAKTLLKAGAERVDVWVCARA